MGAVSCEKAPHQHFFLKKERLQKIYYI